MWEGGKAIKVGDTSFSGLPSFLRAEEWEPCRDSISTNKDQAYWLLFALYFGGGLQFLPKGALELLPLTAWRPRSGTLGSPTRVRG